MDFSEVAARQMAGETVHRARLLSFDFKSGLQRYWPGEYVLTNLDGRKWQPTEGHGAVSGLAQSYNGRAPELKFTLSGVDAGIVEKAAGAEDEYFGRRAGVYWQFFDANWAPIGPVAAVTWGLMRRFIAKMEPVDEGHLFTVTLTAETPFVGRGKARHGYLTDTDQKARHPGDQIASRIAGMETRRLRWPQF